MKNKYKFLVFILNLFLLFLATNQAVFALELTYPTIPGFGKPVANNLESYVSYLFGFMCYIAGAMALISFAIGAVQLIMSASNPSNVNEAKDRMKGSVLGLVLTLSAVLILKTINPQLIEINMTALPATNGVYYTNGTNFLSAPISANVSEITKGYETFYYKCDSETPILIWLFKNTGGDYSGGAETKRLNCGDDVNLSGYGSFKWDYDWTGIYYCLGGCNGNMCKGYMSEVITRSDENIATPFRGNINGVRIVNDTNSSEYYGAIFHGGLKVTDGGECTEPILPTTDVSCTSVNMSTFSADIFQWNKDDPDSSGSGITFYNLPYGWNTDVQAGSITVYKEDIKNANSIFKKNSFDLKYDFSKVESEEADFCNTYPSCSEYEDYIEGTDNFSDGLYALVKEGFCCPCTTLKDCLGSIRIGNGGYIVGLYSKATNVFSDDKEVLYCKTATKDVENLYAYDYVESTDKKIEYIYIIPTK